MKSAFRRFLPLALIFLAYPQYSVQADASTVNDAGPKSFCIDAPKGTKKVVFTVGGYKILDSSAPFCLSRSILKRQFADLALSGVGSRELRVSFRRRRPSDIRHPELRYCLPSLRPGSCVKPTATPVGATPTNSNTKEDVPRPTPTTIPTKTSTPLPPTLVPTPSLTPVATLVPTATPVVSFSVVFESEEVITPTQRANQGLTHLGDGSFGFARLSGRLFGFGALATGGTQKFEVLNPYDLTTWQKIGGPIINRSGLTNSFDRNYASGGPVYRDAVSGIIFHLYHGEYWYNEPAYLPFYPGIGIAISKDGGATWKKLGQVLAPNFPRAAGNPAQTTNPCYMDIGGGTLTKKDEYLYAYFTDMEWLPQQQTCWYLDTTVARAKISDLVNAALLEQLPSDGKLFSKYFSPSGQSGAFTEPGVIALHDFAQGGGKFSPILPRSAEYANFPSVAYNSYVNKFVMTHSIGSQLGIGLRFSADGINWSEISKVSDSPGAYYSSIVNLEAEDPQLLGRRFDVVFIDPFNPSNWQAANMKRLRIRLDPR